MPKGDSKDKHEEQKPQEEPAEKTKGKRGGPQTSNERLAWVNAKSSNRGGGMKGPGSGRAGNKSSARRGTRGGR